MKPRVIPITLRVSETTSTSSSKSSTMSISSSVRAPPLRLDVCELTSIAVW